MKRLFALSVGIVVLSLFLVACEKKEDKPLPKAPEKSQAFNPNAPGQPPAQPQGMPTPHGDAAPKAAKAVVVPDAVKGSWPKVTLVFEDRNGKKKTEYTVKVGSTLEIPGSDLKVQVGEFLPDFQMTETTITSKSNEPNNPAVRVEVFEKGQPIYKNWLYSKFPDIHKFEHDRYGLSLKGGAKS